MQRTILRKFYADDKLSGANPIDEARLRQNQLVKTLERGSLDIRKWTSNESRLPLEYREAN